MPDRALRAAFPPAQVVPRPDISGRAFDVRLPGARCSARVERWATYSSCTCTGWYYSVKSNPTQPARWHRCLHTEALAAYLGTADVVGDDDGVPF